MKIMKHLMMVRGFGAMIQHSTFYFMLSMIGQGLFGPYLILQQGTLLTATFISVYTLFGKVVMILLPYFEDVSFKTSCLWLMLKAWSNLLLPLLLLISPLAFLYGVLAWSLVGQMVSAIFTVNYDDYISRGENGRFKKIQLMERVNFSAVGIAAGVLATLLYFAIDMLKLDVGYILYPVVLVQFMTAAYVQWIYHTYWKHIIEVEE